MCVGLYYVLIVHIDKLFSQSSLSKFVLISIFPVLRKFVFCCCVFLFSASIVSLFLACCRSLFGRGKCCHFPKLNSTLLLLLLLTTTTMHSQTNKFVLLGLVFECFSVHVFFHYSVLFLLVVYYFYSFVLFLSLFTFLSRLDWWIHLLQLCHKRKCTRQIFYFSPSVLYLGVPTRLCTTINVSSFE